MPQKKPNAFMVFVMEWKEKNAPRISVPEAISRAGSIWKTMSEKDKQIYKELAKTAPKMPGSNKKGKLTCDGTPIELIEKQQREAELQLEEMNKIIKDTLRNALNTDGLLHKNFYFIMCNHFVRVFQTEDYVPAEIAVVEFSLRTGFNRKYHAFVDPKMEFYGNVYEAKHHADTTHQLPLPPEAFGDKDVEQIFSDILDFIKDKQTGDDYPPLYTHENCMALVDSCLQFLKRNSPELEDSNLKIYSIQQLFYDMKCATSEYGGTDDSPKNKFISDAVLDRDAFQYETNIACNYHEEIDRAHYCALSQVVRWSFTFVDYMGSDLNLTFIPGKHMPDRFNAERVNSTLQKSTLESASLRSACDSMSHMSLTESDYKTCENESIHSNNLTAKGAKALPQTKQSSQINTSICAMSELASTSNPWKRHDTSQAPDSRFFDIDYEESKSTRLAAARRSYGRGIAVLDDDFPILGTNGRGRIPPRV